MNDVNTNTLIHETSRIVTTAMSTGLIDRDGVQAMIVEVYGTLLGCSAHRVDAIPIDLSDDQEA